MRCRYGVVHRRTFERNKRNHIGRAHAWMLALMAVQIDQLGSLPRPAHGGFDDGIRRPRERHDTAIVIAIGLPSEHQHARRALDRFHNRAHHARVIPLGEIRNAFQHDLKL